MNPNAIWFQTSGSLFAQVMRLYSHTKGYFYRYEVYEVYIYPKYYWRPKSGKLIAKGDADTLPLAKKEVFSQLN